MVLDEETKTLLTEAIDEAFAAFVDDQSIKFWEGGIVRSAPTGGPPEYITVEIEGIYDENVMWRGVPSFLQVGDEVVVWENPRTHRREIFGASGATGVTGGISWCQVVTVAKCGGDFTLPSDAITWINALAAGPLDTRLFLIKVLAGNFAETTDITIPSYVTVEGVGEGSEIEMGAFSVIMSSHSGMANIVVESSDPAEVVRINNVNDVLLREVHAIQTSTGDAFHIYGNSGTDVDYTHIKLYNCIAESTCEPAGAGYHIGDTALADLDYCTVLYPKYGYFTDGLEIDATNCDVQARWCTFLGDTYDVQVGMGAGFWHLCCHFDPDHSSLLGQLVALPTMRFNQTVIVAEEGGDFQVPSEAIAFINARGDAAAGNLYGIRMLTGNFVEAANVTVPQYVYIEGMGEGTSIEMGAFDLLMSSYSGLLNVQVTLAAGGSIHINGKTDVILEHVHGLQTSNDDVLYVYGASTEIECKDCHFESTGLEAVYVKDSATVLFDNCRLEADSGSGYALVIADTAVVTTEWCALIASVPVYTGAGTTWNFRSCRFEPGSCTILGTAEAYNANAGDNYALPVKNTSGATRAVGDVGYIDEAGEFKTTITQYDDVSWAVVVIGGPNNGDIWVTRRGRVTVKLDANCSIGDYLYTSGTATQATPQSYMRPEMFAVARTANAAGAGGTCEALLYCHTRFVPKTSSKYLTYINLANQSDFRAQIAGVAGAVVTWNPAGMSGSGNTIDPQAANYLGKIRLYNETDGDYGLIDDVNVGAAQITLTAAAPVGWAVGEWITARSQKCVVGASPYYYDLDLSDTDNDAVPELARAIVFQAQFRDSGATQEAYYHPWEASVASKTLAIYNQAANEIATGTLTLPLFQRRFEIRWTSSGAGTVFFRLPLMGYWKASN